MRQALMTSLILTALPLDGETKVKKCYIICLETECGKTGFEIWHPGSSVCCLNLYLMMSSDYQESNVFYLMSELVISNKECMFHKYDTIK